METNTNSGRPKAAARERLSRDWVEDDSIIEDDLDDALFEGDEAGSNPVDRRRDPLRRNW